MAKHLIFGLLYDSETGKVTLSDGTPPAFGADFTFENVAGYNPLQYATQKTAEQVAEIIKGILPADVKISIKETFNYGMFPTQRLIQLERQGITADLNAGLVANSFIRSGSVAFVLADLKHSGILF